VPTAIPSRHYWCSVQGGAAPVMRRGNSSASDSVRMVQPKWQRGMHAACGGAGIKNSLHMQWMTGCASLAACRSGGSISSGSEPRQR
jgi:hypothetical protein